MTRGATLAQAARRPGGALGLAAAGSPRLTLDDDRIADADLIEVPGRVVGT